MNPIRDTYRKEFAKCIRESAGGYTDLWSAFSCFLELSFCSLSQGAVKMTTGDICPKTEEKYMKAIATVKHPEKMAEAMGQLILGLDNERYDFLGTVAGELELLNSWNGQFFTPSSLCQMMAQMTLGEAKPDPLKRISISEPACGAGAIVIAAGELLKKRGFSPWNYWIDCTDVDQKMFYACYIQLTLCGIPAVIRWGNTITMEQWDSRVTMMGAMFPYRYEESKPLPMKRRLPVPLPSKRQLPK